MGNGRGGRTPPTADLARFMGHGITFAASTGLFLLVGWWADGRLGTRPLLTLLGALLGAALGFYSMYYKLVVEPRERKRDDADERGD
jgi:F0F1-type ATP synthase assembly protein I